MKIATLLLFLLLNSQNAFGQTETGEITMRAFALMRENKVSDALAEISKAIAMEPDKAGPYITRASIYRFAKDYLNVRKDADRAIQLEPDSEKTFLSVARVLQNGFREDCERTGNYAEAFLARFPNSSAVYAHRASAKSCLGDIIGAFNDWTRAAELNPTEPTYQANRASTISKLGDNQKALELYQQLIDEIKPRIAKEKGTGQEGRSSSDLLAMYASRARVHDAMGNADLAIADLSNAVAVQEDEFSLNQRYAAYKKAGRFNDAISDMSKIIQIAKANATRVEFPPPSDWGKEQQRKAIAARLFERASIYATIAKYQEALTDYNECLVYDQSRKEMVEKRIADIRTKQADATAKPK